jgi:catechol 2,3-dioxygenase-like lactoylglutathione lyase family enzyme
MPQLRHVAMTTHNVEKTAKFYIDVFGMKERARSTIPARPDASSATA